VNEILGPRYERALLYACQVHAAQRRKGGDIPYLSHLLAVSSLVIEDGAAAGELREDEAIAALLHDTAEDQGGERRLRDVEARFGSRVAEIVEACSDSLTEDASAKAPWRERKQRHLDHLERATDPGILRVVLADKVHNARSVLADYRVLGDALWARFHSEADTPWYYRRLAEVFARKVPRSTMTDDLVRIVAGLPESPPTGG
jgi:(p)ppGpp synthase/HD superfamily hydrolase